MEEEKAAAYYEELVRKGGNAARFKQGLGFGGSKGSEVSSSSIIIPKSDAHASLSNFVKQASPGRAAAIQTEIRAESIRDKLKKKETIPSDEYHDSRRKHRQSSSDRSRKRSRTPLHSRNPRDRSHSTERCQEWTRRSSSRDRDRRRRGTSVERIRKGRSLSLSQEREKGNGDGRSERPGRSSATRVDTSSRRHGRNGDSKTKVKTRAPDRDFLKLIPNFDSMTPAEKVKAKMKLQLSETVVKDTAKGMTGEWERFDFDKDAPLDDEAKLDYFGDKQRQTSLICRTGNRSQFILQARREAHIQAAHDAAIFGAPVATTHGLKTKKEGSGHRVRDGEEDNHAARRRSDVTSLTDEEERSKVTETPGTGVVSEQIIAMQSAGSWQERAKKMREARAAAAGLHMEASAS
ncbi:unnamed protein product [Sphagnum jensenii]|uniref:Uncharacterized protein n=1 Tax=Sphagnum jensenii TaxID=128206 RepID=A0ABP0XDC4_9BRYO